MEAAAAAGSLRHDVRVMGMIGVAHGFSHFYQVILPPLFPILKVDLDVSYTALGILSGVFFIAGGLFQTPAGFLVDRYGARPVLLVGLAVFAGAIAATGLAPSYWAMLPIALIAGFGNSVFHPADYAILNASIDPTRLGRAYGVHGIFGNLGWALAPVAGVAMSAMIGWRTTLVVLGCIGLAMAMYLVSQRDSVRDHRTEADRAASGTAVGQGTPVLKLLLTRPILLLFAFFFTSAAVLIGVQNFAAPALMAFHDMPLLLATGSLTAFLLGGAAGTLAGGFITDRTTRHELIAGIALLVGAILFLPLLIPDLPHALIPVVFAATGIVLGIVGPSRDMIIRKATRLGSSGKIYGFVYSGLDLGGAITPPLFGWLMDRGEPRMIFLAMAAINLLALVAVWRVPRQLAPAAAE